MNQSKGSCDPAMISRFFDQELDQEEYDQVARHIETCPLCQKTLDELELLSGMANETIRENWSEAAKGSVEEKVLESILKTKAPWWIKARGLFLSKKILIPLTTSAALILFLSVFFRSPAQTGPSAIVTSLSGNMSSVIIMETPQTHQTILWFKESSTSEGQTL
jgi:hypothetical protein